jgi:hypothetical protein
MKTSFQDIAKRITGISVPVFGISWDPPTLEVDVARHLITYLEDRRVLYHPYSAEVPERAIASVLDIRQRLTHDLEQLDRTSELAQLLSAMRAACRKFLDDIDKLSIPKKAPQFGQRMTGHNMVYFAVYGELRAVFGIYLAKIAIEYGIDIEPQLASIIPSLAEDSFEDV